jgi:hypothetical protein
LRFEISSNDWLSIIRVSSSQESAAVRVGKWSTLIAITIISVAVRLAPLLRSDLSFAFYPDDSFEYLQLADGMRNGCGFARFINGACQPPEILRTPGYPVFLTAFGHNLRLVLGVQALTGGIVGLMIAVWLLQKWSFIAAVTAQLLIAFDLPSIVLANGIMAEALFQTLVAAAVLVSLLVEARPRAASALGFFTGVLGGLATLTRPIGIVLPLLLPIPFLAEHTIRCPRRLLAAGLAFGIPLIIIAGWAARNYESERYPGLSTVGAINMYYYRAANVVARQEGTGLEATWKLLGTRLGVPYERIYRADVQSAALAHRMNSLAFKVLVAHPTETLLMTAQASIYLAVTPMRSPVARMIGTVGSSEGNGLNAGTLTIKRVRDTLMTVLQSPLLTAMVLLQVVLTLFLWVGIVLAAIHCLRADVNYRLWVLYLLVTGAVLVVLAAGGEADVRFRSPAIPLLAAVAALGYVPKRLPLSSTMSM